MTQTPELEPHVRDRHITFGRVLSRARRRLVVDLCGVAVAFSSRDGKILSARARAYELLATIPVVGDELERVVLRWEPPARRRARRVPTNRGAQPRQAEDTGP